MDPVCHILFSTALARSEIIPASREAQVIIILAGLVPDLDLIFRARGLPQYFIHHRRESHSLLGILGLSLPLSALAKFLAPGLSYPQLYSCVWLGLLGHIFLDFLTVYGVPLIFPLRKKFYNFGILFIIDPWLDLFLLPSVLEKIIPAPRPGPARISLLIAFAYLALLAILKLSAQARGKKIISEKFPGLDRAQVYTSPFLALPFSWLILLKNHHTIHRMRFSLLFGPGPIAVFNSGISDRQKGWTQKSSLLKAMINFSDFLHWQVSEQNPCPKILAWDLRFSQYNLGFRAEAEFQPEGNPVSEKFSYY